MACHDYLTYKKLEMYAVQMLTEGSEPFLPCLLIVNIFGDAHPMLWLCNGAGMALYRWEWGPIRTLMLASTKPSAQQGPFAAEGSQTLLSSTCIPQSPSVLEHAGAQPQPPDSFLWLLS